MTAHYKPNILYVDDEEINLELFQFAFENTFNVKTAISGCEGLKVIKNNKEIDIVITDMKMPCMNGVEFILKVKNINGKLPCIILSGFEKTDEIDDAINDKLIEDYVMKPINKQEIKKSIDYILRKKSASD